MTIEQPTIRLQVTIAETAIMLGVDSSTVRRMLARGDLDYTGHGRGRRVITSSIYAYIEANRKNNARATY